MWRTILLSVALLDGASASAATGSDRASSWRPMLEEAAAQFDAAISDSNCRPVPGRIAICSDAYGHGWLAIAQVWSSGGRTVQAIVKLNDTYFSLARFERPEARTRVLKEALTRVLSGDPFDGDVPLPPAMLLVDLNGPDRWGELVEGSAAGPLSVYRLDFGDGNLVTTYVTWVPLADDHGP